MFEGVKTGWRIASAIRRQLFQDKTLLLYPVLSAIVIILEAVLIGASFLFALLHSAAYGSPAILVEEIVLLFIFYLLSSFTSAYFVMALYIGFKSHANGEKIGIGEALRRAKSYAKQVLEWSLFLSTVILVLRIIESRFKGIAKLAFGFAADLTLSLGMLFAYPLIYENRFGPIKAVRTSAEMLIHYFGPMIGGVAYYDLYGIMFVVLGGILLTAGSPAAYAVAGLAGAIVAIFAGISLIVFGAVLISATSNIFRLLLYEYASGKGLPSWLDESTVKQAIKYKKQAGTI